MPGSQVSPLRLGESPLSRLARLVRLADRLGVRQVLQAPRFEFITNEMLDRDNVHLNAVQRQFNATLPSLIEVDAVDGMPS